MTRMEQKEMTKSSKTDNHVLDLKALRVNVKETKPNYSDVYDEVSNEVRDLLEQIYSEIRRLERYSIWEEVDALEYLVDLAILVVLRKELSEIAENVRTKFHRTLDLNHYYRWVYENHPDGPDFIAEQIEQYANKD